MKPKTEIERLKSGQDKTLQTILKMDTYRKLAVKAAKVGMSLRRYSAMVLENHAEK